MQNPVDQRRLTTIHDAAPGCAAGGWALKGGGVLPLVPWAESANEPTESPRTRSVPLSEPLLPRGTPRLSQCIPFPGSAPLGPLVKSDHAPRLLSSSQEPVALDVVWNNSDVAGQAQQALLGIATEDGGMYLESFDCSTTLTSLHKVSGFMEHLFGSVCAWKVSAHSCANQTGRSNCQGQ